MEVEISPVTQGELSTTQELADVLAALERATGMQICLKALSGGWGPDGGVGLLGKYWQHRSTFCSAVKGRVPAKCVKNEYADLPGLCSTPEGPSERPFLRTCHAGAEEVLMPLWYDGVLVGMLCAGQFVTERHPAPRRRPAGLHEVDQSQIEHVSSLLTAVRSYALDLYASRERGRRSTSEGGRASQIETYIKEALSSGPELAGLARTMSLSPSRTRHVVSETTGRSFRQLVTAQRLSLAKDLLLSSDGQISWIARQVGLPDSAYFCRFFKTHTGVTPGMFRASHRRELSG